MATLQTILKNLAGVALAPVLALSLAGCDNFFGDKTSDSFITPPVPDNRAVAYVAVQPSFGGFNRPIGVIAGNDQLFYVVDAGTNELVCLNQSGVRLSRRSFPGITAVAQDRRLDLLVLARYDYPSPSGEVINVPVIFRLNLKQPNGYGLANAVITDTIIQPFYFARNRGAEGSKDTPVQFNGIAVLPDNRFLVTRSGPGADAVTGVPDDAVLLFDGRDKFITTIDVSGEGGVSYSNFFKKPFGIATVPTTSDIFGATESQDFIVTTQDVVTDTVRRVIYIQAASGEEGVTYQVKDLPFPNDTTIRGSLYQSDKFRRPMGVAFARDQTNYIFVTDGDSLYQFTPEGFEGVKLTASTLKKGYNKVSFGGTGSGPYKFNDPRGIAYLNQVIYVADSRNGEIKRFKLSTDFQ